MTFLLSFIGLNNILVLTTPQNKMSTPKVNISRAHRPQKFSDVLGQDSLVTVIKNMIRLNQIGPAYLFYGKRGCGKTTLARIFAKRLNCEKPEDEEPCNSCPSCMSAMSNSLLNIVELDAASNRGIEDIRNLKETIHFEVKSGYRVFIIDEVHMLTKEAFNALLKTLEEPPKKTVFMFATTELQKVPDTIKSRCQICNIASMEQGTIVSKLDNILKQLKVKHDGNALNVISEYANGSLRDAESLLEQAIALGNYKSISEDQVTSFLGHLDQSSITNLYNVIVSSDVTNALSAIEQMAKGVVHIDSIYHQLFTFFSGKWHANLSMSESEKIILTLDLLRNDLKELNRSTNPLIHIKMTVIGIIKVYTLPTLGELKNSVRAITQKTPPQHKTKQTHPFSFSLISNSAT